MGMIFRYVMQDKIFFNPKHKHMARKYSPKAGEKVEKVMHEMKEGKLKSGSGRKVTSRKQAIAIGLSEAREEGAKVPEKKTEEAWREDVALLHGLHAKLREAVAGVDERKLDYVTRRLIHGAAGHDIYHAGQIKLMRRLVG